MISRIPFISISNPLTEVEKLICSTMSLSETILFFREKIVGMQVKSESSQKQFSPLFCKKYWLRNDGRSPPVPRKLPLIPGTVDDVKKSLPSAHAKMVSHLTMNTIGTRRIIWTRITDRTSSSFSLIHFLYLKRHEC
ncbi:hypothetical protein TNCV_3579891 [Trichonephila clavipes]|nr:hypothetical protein TNCV_3579891 [Trichonephila clavipes]